MSMNSLFDKYANTLAQLPGSFAEGAGLPACLRMDADGRYEVYYAPFDYVNTSARIVLVGITPGRTQALEAISVARRALLGGRSFTDAAEAAKKVASFAGPLRKNLVALLDSVGVSERLGLASTADLWTSHTHLVHFTSALRYPVMERGKGYGGAGLARSAFLKKQVDRWFATECRALNSALYVPLGSGAQAACEYLVQQGLLGAKQILGGLPLPSGANAERIAYFLGRKPRSLLSSKTRADVLDEGRTAALKVVEAWA
jgi:hypothetical protein